MEDDKPNASPTTYMSKRQKLPTCNYQLKIVII